MRELPKLPLFRTVSRDLPKTLFPDASCSLVNAMSIANRAAWEDTMKALLQQVCSLYLMPDDKKCLLAMLEANDFFRQPGLKQTVYVRDVVGYMNEHCTDGQICIVRSSCTNEYTVIFPDDPEDGNVWEEDGFRYHAYGLADTHPYYVTDIWVRWADRQDHSPSKRRKGRTAAPKAFKIPPDHDTFHYCQENPENRTGDCVIRALASACRLPWREVISQIMALSEYKSSAVNTLPFYTKFLEHFGFEHRKPILLEGKKLRGKEFCRELDRRLLCGGRVVAHVAPNHMVAILPFSENGVTHYKIVDSWDSSNCPVSDYWILEETGKESAKSKETALLVGSEIRHPVFGRGTVKDIHQSGYMGVFFVNDGYRRLDCRWVMHNCQQL